MPREEIWAHSLQHFANEMLDKLIAQIPEKGHPTKERLKNCPPEYLKKKLLEHLEAGNFVDVANFAFLLEQLMQYQLENNPKEEGKE